MKPVGHGDVVDQLAKDLPPVSLLIGPASVGKRTTCDWALSQHGAREADVLRFMTLNVEAAREARRAFSVRPSGRIRAVFARLDGASAEGLNALLKVMEETPKRCHFLLTCERRPMLTVMSRARVHSLGYLRQEEVREVLLRLGKTEESAERLARSSGGQVRAALEHVDAEAAKGPVLRVLKATADGNLELFYNATMGKRAVDETTMEDAFGWEQLRLLRRWVHEARTGFWRTFTSSEGFGLQEDPEALRRISAGLALEARPRIAVKLALLKILEDRAGRG